jgi:hypothetical protein
MPERILTIVNVVLILVSGACIVVLATSHYEKPTEVATMEQMLTGGPAPEPIAETAIEAPPVKLYSNLDRPFMKPLYTPTPTPTPRPAPTPPPPKLAEAVMHWQIRSLDPGEALFVDDRDNSMFTLKVGGPPREGRDGRNLPIPVTLQAVDQQNLSVTFTGLGQTEIKTMKF